MPSGYVALDLAKMIPVHCRYGESRRSPPANLRQLNLTASFSLLKFLQSSRSAHADRHRATLHGPLKRTGSLENPDSISADPAASCGLREQRCV